MGDYHSGSYLPDGLHSYHLRHVFLSGYTQVRVLAILAILAHDWLPLEVFKSSKGMFIFVSVARYNMLTPHRNALVITKNTHES